VGGDIEEEIIFDDFGDLSTANLPHEFRLDSSEDSEEVGRIGEQLVYNFLKKRETFNGLIIEEVIWINRHRETGDPFDILLKLEDDCGSLNEVFIEVKATKTEDKVSMGISLRELDFASVKQDRYYLYRVFNIGENKKPKLVSINNIKEKLDRKLIRLCIICPAKIALGNGSGVGAFNGKTSSSSNQNLPAINTSPECGKEPIRLLQNRQPAMLNNGAEINEAILAALPTPRQKQVLGERLFPLISSLTADPPAGKITGMLLDLNNSDVLGLLESPEMLAAKVDEAVMVLKKAGNWNPPIPSMGALTASKLASMLPQEQKQAVGERLFPLIADLAGYQVAGKITGMLLEILNNSQLLHLLDSKDALSDIVENACCVGAAQESG
jgi:hypothetical protein